jgi:hypothetical protein
MKKKIFLFSFFFCFLFYSLHSQDNVGIGTTTPNPTAVLDITATNKGVLVPRLTSIQRLAISSPANGLLVFDSDLDCFYFYSTITTSWASLCTTGTRYWCNRCWTYWCNRTNRCHRHNRCNRNGG